MKTRRLPPAVSQTSTTQRDVPIVRRRFERAAVHLPAQYTIADQASRAAIIDNLGGGGVRLQTEEDLAAGTSLALKFLIDDAPVTVLARVSMSLFDRSCGRFVHGVAFTSIHPEVQRAIENSVTALLRT